MPFWPFSSHKPLMTIQSPTYELNVKASYAFSAKDWPKAEHLYREVLAKSDQEGRQVARNMLGRICERQKRVDEAIAFYEANVIERSPFGWPYHRLAIIYHRLGQLTEEKRVVVVATHTLPEKAREWHLDRLKKITN